MVELPDPFRFMDGNGVTSEDEWSTRRGEISELIQDYQYGHMPPPPEKFEVTETSSQILWDGEATEMRFTVKTGPGLQLGIRASMVVPEGSGPFPVILKNDRDLELIPNAREVSGRGYIVAKYIRHDLDNDDADRTDGVHPLYPDYDWGTLSAWAWGSMRIIDYLLELDFVDGEKIAVTGHSRGGKTALLAAALDERIAMAAPNGSGTGGAGSYRIVGEGAETLEAITRVFPFWFSPNLGKFVGRETRLPFDQHLMRALVAPRSVISTDALGDHWANPLGTQHMYLASRPVFEWLCVGEKNGLHFRQGGHAQNEEDWRALVDFSDLVYNDEDIRGKFDLLPFPDAAPAFSWNHP
ncbi:MAG: acetylxylan esterase [Theionarchaea archaeon]|nr:acetylxylan esterase [Theionarchaea archaeon]